MRYFIIAGEASGDLHGANLMKALREKDSQAVFVGLGGDKMRAEGCKICVDYRDMAYMGIVAVLRNIGKVKRNFSIAKLALQREQPDVLILIDYPTFNLKIAKFCKTNLARTKVVYYIPPKVWAWKKWRVHSIAKYCDQILGIFPFEPAFYAKYGYTCQYVGNTTADCIQEFKLEKGGLSTTHEEELKNQSSKSIIAILPGSRRSEISQCLHTMLEASRQVAGNQYQIVVAKAPGVEDVFYQPFIQDEILTRDTYKLLMEAKAAIVNSGTATLETALIGCPQTAVYYIAGSKYLEALLRPIIFSIPHFTLVNIILQDQVIQELIASRFTVENLIKELNLLLHDTTYRSSMMSKYQLLHDILGNTSASNNAADKIYTLLNLNSNETNQ